MRLFYIFVFILFTSISNPSYSLDGETCADLMAEANSDLGAKYFYVICMQEDTLIFRSKKFKCAQKAMKGKTSLQVQIINMACHND